MPSEFITDYSATLKHFQRLLKELNFPVKKFKRDSESPSIETFTKDNDDGDVTYTANYGIFLHPDDEEAIEIDFKLYIEFLYSPHVYTELKVKIDGELLEGEDLDAAIVFLRRKDATAADELADWVQDCHDSRVSNIPPQKRVYGGSEEDPYGDD